MYVQSDIKIAYLGWRETAFSLQLTQVELKLKIQPEILAQGWLVPKAEGQGQAYVLDQDFYHFAVIVICEYVSDSFGLNLSPHPNYHHQSAHKSRFGSRLGMVLNRRNTHLIKFTFFVITTQGLSLISYVEEFK